MPLTLARLRRRAVKRSAADDRAPRHHRQEARPRHRPRHLRRLPGLRDQLQGVEHAAATRRRSPTRTPTAPIRTAPGSTACTATRWARAPTSRTVHFPRSCLHCEEPACVTVCPTGASYKRAEDGIVLVDPDTCIGCKLCSWACPYGAREYDYGDGVMKKCTLCVDRIYNEHLPEEDRVPACVRACPTGARHFGDLGDRGSAVSQLVAERGGFDLLPEFGYKPVNKYLPPRPRRDADGDRSASRPRTASRGARRRRRPPVRLGRPRAVRADARLDDRATSRHRPRRHALPSPRAREGSGVGGCPQPTAARRASLDAQATCARSWLHPTPNPSPSHAEGVPSHDGRGSRRRSWLGRRHASSLFRHRCSRPPRARATGCWCGSRLAACSACCRPSAGSASSASRWPSP